MESVKKSNQRKGGRPKKAIGQTAFIGVKCSHLDKSIIRQKAKSVGLTMSEFLRELGLKGQAVRQVKSLTKEILQWFGTCNHIRADLNQIAKKRNRFDDLDALERAIVTERSKQLEQMIIDVKKFLK